MNAEALPYTILIFLLELAAGSAAFVAFFDARRMVTEGYVQTAALIAVTGLLLAVWAASAVAPVADIDGYTLRLGALGLFRVILTVTLVMAALYLLAAVRRRRRARLALGVAAAASGALAIAVLAHVLGAPAWSYLGLLAGMLAGSVVVGGALMAMSWGHWYLTNAGLPRQPLEQMALVVLGALGVQAVLVVLALVVPAREVPFGASGIGVTLGENPAFWLRVLVGFGFPAPLLWLAYRAATMRGMMSATGLLYIATGAVFAGELLGRGLLFATGAPL